MTLADEDTNTILNGEVNWELAEYAVMMTLVDEPCYDLADVTLIDEDDVNKEIPSNMTMQLEPPGGQISS